MTSNTFESVSACRLVPEALQEERPAQVGGMGKHEGKPLRGKANDTTSRRNTETYQLKDALSNVIYLM